MTLRNVGLCALAATLVWTLAGCGGGKPEDKKDVAADLAAVNALRGKFTTAFNSNDAAAVAALYADDGIMMEPNQPAVEGRVAIQAAYEAMFKASTVKIALTPLETQLAADWAYDRGTVVTTVTPKSGSPLEESGKYLVVLKRLPGGLWKVYRDMNNGNSAPAAAPGKKSAKKAPAKRGGRRR